MSTEEPVLKRSSSLSHIHRDSTDKKRCRSELNSGISVRCPSQKSFRPALSAVCAHCKLPLGDDADGYKDETKTRPISRQSGRLCQECAQERVTLGRSPSSRLYKSASVDWTNMGDKIETWFAKAKTPDQRVVYNFLEKINLEPQKEIEPANGKSLDDILNNLKKYRTRFGSARSPNKFTRVFESTSWRVMRHPSAPRPFTRYDPVYGDDASRDLHIGSVFATTEPRIGSTFLIHPGWV